MTPNNRLLRFFIWFIILYAPLCMPPAARAQAKEEDIQAAYNYFWIDYKLFLEKIKAEKSNYKAAQLVDQMKQDILPRLAQLVKRSEAWKKSHTPSDIKKMKDWVSSNPHASAVSNLQAELMVLASRQGGDLGKAFGAYMHAVTMLDKKN